MRRADLSAPLPVFGLVGRYPANYLIGDRSVPDRRSFARWALRPSEIIGYYPAFQRAIPVSRVGYLSITRPSATPCVATERSTCMS